MTNPPALLLIDIQQGLDDPRWGKRNNPMAEMNMALLLRAWRNQRYPIIHVRHCSTDPDSPLRPGQPGNALKPCAQPQAGEPEFTKTVNSAFMGTDLEAYLHEQGISSLVIIGLTTDHCVSTSVRMAANLGFDVTLVADATATFERQGADGVLYDAETMHQVNLASLNGEFSRVMTTQTLLLELEQAADYPS